VVALSHRHHVQRTITAENAGEASFVARARAFMARGAFAPVG